MGATTRVYKYGARPAGDDVRAQMVLGRRYYNNLVEAENARDAGLLKELASECQLDG